NFAFDLVFEVALQDLPWRLADPKALELHPAAEPGVGAAELVGDPLGIDFDGHLLLDGGNGLDLDFHRAGEVRPVSAAVKRKGFGRGGTRTGGSVPYGSVCGH